MTNMMLIIAKRVTAGWKEFVLTIIAISAKIAQKNLLNVYRTLLPIPRTRSEKNGTTEYLNKSLEKNLQYSRFSKGLYSEIQIKNVWKNNVDNLLQLIKYIHNKGYKSFRISSNLFPLYDSSQELLESYKEIIPTLEEIGKFAISNGIRLTTHPDQFVVISSRNPNVISKSIKMLEYHAWVFDKMKLPTTTYYAINIHGGVSNNHQTLIDSILSLPENIKSRLTLENDERSYSVADLFHVYEKTNVPIVFDTHHWAFNSGNLTQKQGFDLARKTWKEKPLTHLSNTEPSKQLGSFTELRKHSDYVHYIPDWQLNANNSGEIDIDFEFKMKNLAIEKAVKEFGITL